MLKTTDSDTDSTNGANGLFSRITRLRTKLIFAAAFTLFVIVRHLLGARCIYRTLFGIQCPGCGMTRAVLAVLHLRIGEAFSYNFMIWSIPVLIIWILTDCKPTESRFVNVSVLLCIALGFAVLFVLRLFGILTVN